MTKSSSSKQRKLRKVSERVAPWTDADLFRLHQMLTANVDHKVKPPRAIAGKVWSMLDSGSQPNVADCKKTFPHLKIRESAGQRQGLQYTGADGSLIPNEGECQVVHREADGTTYKVTVQHARVHCQILSVSELVFRDCVVTFHKAGGHITYPDGRRIRFVAKEGVCFVLLNALDQDC